MFAPAGFVVMHRSRFKFRSRLVAVFCACICQTFLVSNMFAQSDRISIHDIKSPRLSGGWVVDMSGTVSAEAIEHINMVCEEINQRLKREMCVVVIPTTNGIKHQNFATDLFNLWGVGARGIPGAPDVWRNNGIMLFVATDDRQAWISLGDGIDGPEQTRQTQQIIDDVILPRYREDDGDSALYEGIRACATRIYSVADLDAPSLLPSVSGTDRATRPVRRHKRRGPVTWFPWICGGALFGGVGLLIGGRYYMRYRPRHCKTCSDEMIRLEEEQDDQFLNDAEQTEEFLGSVDYDIWACLKCEEVQKIRYGKLLTRYSKCPKCWYITVLKIKNTIIRANYVRGGKVRVDEDCKSCDYHRTYTYRTPKRVKSSSSSGSSSGSSFGGGGGGGSGFSGGSSSGGGAGGGW